MKKYPVNLKKSPVDERDYVAESIFPSKAEPLPEILDLRSDLMSVRDQGNQGSCAAMSSSCMKEWQEKKDVNFSGYMSPQFIYNNRENQDSEGMYSRDVMKILNKIGSVPESYYPYETKQKITEDLKSLAKNYTIKGYAQIYTIDGLKKALATNGPCYIAFPVYNFENRFWKPQQGDVSYGGHAVLVVGYNKEGFIIRNSWGKEWNDNGYTIFPYLDFGLQWEIWTTIDENSSNPYKPPVIKKTLFEKIIEWFLNLFK